MNVNGPLHRVLCSLEVVVGDGKPSLGGFAEIGANLVEGLALGVTARQCGDRGGEAANIGFWTYNRGEYNREINSKSRSRGSGEAHGKGPPIIEGYLRTSTRSRAPGT